MNFNRKYVKKALTCAPLLPPPGDEEVKKFAEDWLTLDSKLVEFQTLLARLVEVAKAEMYPYTFEASATRMVLKQIQKAFEEAGCER
jgi:hypothetical protein